ncbi:hypothetical protein LTR66_007733 [Elasticomyces elasticus]|nr:hypothetical protein LTR66_007733 [Elasticomyces elasticus]
MWKSLTGKSNISSPSSSHRRKPETTTTTPTTNPQTRRPSVSIVSSSSARKPSRAGSTPVHTATTYPPSSSRHSYANAESPLSASVYTSASSSRNEGGRSYSSPSASHDHSLTAEAMRSMNVHEADWEDVDAPSERTGTTSGRRRRHRHYRSRSHSRSRERDERSERLNEKDDKSRSKHRGKESTMTEGSSERSLETTRGPTGFNAQFSGASFSQFPDQYEQPTPRTGPPPQHHIEMSSHVQDQFPGQNPSTFAAPYHPLNRPMTLRTESAYGLAADYYNDQGQSVRSQPGVRPATPKLIVGAEPHLQPASVEERPPLETGHGSAAAYYTSGALEDKSTVSGVPATPIKPPRPGKSSSVSSSRPVKNEAATSIAPTVSTTPPVYPPNFHSASEPVIPTAGSFAPSSSGQSRRSGMSSSQSHTNGPLYAAGAAGLAAGVYGSHEHRQHQEQRQTARPSYGQDQSGSSLHLSRDRGFINSTRALPPANYTDPGLDMEQQQQHRHRGPVSKFVDWWKDYEDVQKMEEYTEYLGVCRHCFDPHTSVHDAPRKHHYHGRRSSESLRRRSRDSLRQSHEGGKSSRVEKERRYGYNGSSVSMSASESERRRGGHKGTKGSSWIATGLMGYGLAKAGKSLLKGNDSFEEASVKSGRRRRSRSRETDPRSATSRGVIRRRSREDGISVRIQHESDRAAKRSRSRSRSRDRKNALLGVAAGATLGASVVGRTVKSRDHSPRMQGAFVRRRSRSHERDHPQGAFFSHQSRSRDHDRHDRATGAFVRYKHDDRSRSRSHSPGLGEILGLTSSASKVKSRSRHPRSPNTSYVDVSRAAKTQSTGMFGGFFSPTEKKRKQHRVKEKKKSSFFTFGNGSSSSSGSDLAFGAGFARQSRRRSPKRTSRRNSKEKLDAALIGIGATAAALAAAQGRRKTSKKRDKVTSVKVGRDRDGQRRDAHGHQPSLSSSSADKDEGWESASDHEDAYEDGSSVSSGLAFGDFDIKGKKPAHRSSMDSLASQSSGTGKWGWRWGGKSKKRRRGSEEFRPPLTSPYDINDSHIPSSFADETVLGTGVVAGGMLDHRQRGSAISSASSVLISQQPLRLVDPQPLEDYADPSPASKIANRPGPVPIQQPQPIAPIRSGVYTTLPSERSAYTAPSGLPVFAQGNAPQTSIRPPGDYDASIVPAPPPARTTQRTQSSPQTSTFAKDVAILGAGVAAAAATAGILSNVKEKGRDQTDGESPGSVRFELTERQRRREERTRRKESRIEEEKRKANAEGESNRLEGAARREAEEQMEIDKTRTEQGKIAREEAAKREMERLAVLGQQREEERLAREAAGEDETKRRRKAEETAAIELVAKAELAARRNQERHEQEQRIREAQRRSDEAAESQRERYEQEQNAGNAKGQAKDAARIDYGGHEHEQRTEAKRIRRERDLEDEIERKRQELESHEREATAPSSPPNVWSGHPVAGIAGATAGAIAAGFEHRSDNVEISHVPGEFQVRVVSPNFEHQGEPLMDDEIFDPDFFRRKRSPSNAARAAILARKAADKVVADLEQRYHVFEEGKEPSQAEFFAPPELTERSEGKTKVTDPIADNNVVVYNVPNIDYHYEPPLAYSTARDGREPKRPWNVPVLNVIAPTPPASHAGSVKGDKSAPPSPLVQAQDATSGAEADVQTDRSTSMVSWGPDETRVYEVETPESVREQFVVDHDSPMREVVIEGESTGDGATKKTHRDPDLRNSANEEGFIDHERPSSPPRSQNAYRSPFDQTVSGLGFDSSSPGAERAPPARGFVEGETDEPTPVEEKAPHVTGGFDDEEDNEAASPREPVGLEFVPPLGKKDKKKRDKAAKKGSEMQDSPSVTPANEEALVQADPESTWDPPLSAKEKKKRDKAAKRASLVGEPPSVTSSVERNTFEPEDEPIYTPEPAYEPPLSAKERKKREKAAKRATFHDDSTPATPVMEETVKQLQQSEAPAEDEHGFSLSKKDKKKRDRAAKQGLFEDEPSAVTQTVEEPASAQPEELAAVEPTSKKDKKKRGKTAKRGMSQDDSDLASPMAEETAALAQKEEPAAEEPEYYTSKKNKKKRDKGGERRGVGEVAAVLLSGRASADSGGDAQERESDGHAGDEHASQARGSATDPATDPGRERPNMPGDWQSSTDDSNASRNLGDTGEPALSEEERRIIPSTTFDNAEELVDAKADKKKSKKRNSGRFGSPVVGSPLRSEVAFEDYVGSRVVEEAPSAEDVTFPPYNAGIVEQPAARDRQGSRLADKSSPDHPLQTTSSRSESQEAGFEDFETPKKTKKSKKGAKRETEALDSGPSSLITGLQFSSPESAAFDAPRGNFDDSEQPKTSKSKKPKKGSAGDNEKPLNEETNLPAYDRAFDGSEDDITRRDHGVAAYGENPLVRSPERDVSSGVSSPVDDGYSTKRVKGHKSKRESESDILSETEDHTVAMSELADPHEGFRELKKGKKKKSKRDGNDYADAASVVSSRSGSRHDEEESPKQKKEKKGFFGMFSRKSAENVPQREEPAKSIAEDRVDDEKTRRRKKKHRDSDGGVDDERSIAPESVNNLSEVRSKHNDDDDGRRSTGSSEKQHKHRRRSRDGSVDDEGEGSQHQTGKVDNPSPSHHPPSHYTGSVLRIPKALDSDATTIDKGGSVFAADNRIKNSSSFLGERVEDSPPLPTNSPSSPILMSEGMNEGELENKVEGPAGAVSQDGTVPAFDAAESLLLHAVEGNQERHSIGTKDADSENRLPTLPESRSSSPLDAETVAGLSGLPQSGPGSLDDSPETPQRPVLVPRPSSSTAIPLRFRRPPLSPGVPRERSMSYTSPTGAGPSSPLSPSRHKRLKSTEFQHSTEFRPLYLVERNRKTPEVEEVLPSLPSSKTTSRASSLYGSEGYQSALEDATPSEHSDGVFVDAADENGQLHDDYLGSAQTTPKATEFPKDVHDLIGAEVDVTAPSNDAPAAMHEDILRSDPVRAQHKEEVSPHTASEEPSGQHEGTRVAVTSACGSGHEEVLQVGPHREHDIVVLPSLPGSHPSSSYQGIVEELSEPLSGAGTAGPSASTTDIVSIDSLSDHGDKLNRDIWGSSDPADAVSQLHQLEGAVIQTVPDEAQPSVNEVPVRPALLRSASSKTGKKGKKGRATMLGTADISEPSPPLDDPEELKRRMENDARDAVDMWFGSEPIVDAVAEHVPAAQSPEPKGKSKKSNKKQKHSAWEEDTAAPIASFEDEQRDSPRSEVEIQAVQLSPQNMEMNPHDGMVPASKPSLSHADMDLPQEESAVRGDANRPESSLFDGARTVSPSITADDPPSGTSETAENETTKGLDPTVSDGTPEGNTLVDIAVAALPNMALLTRKKSKKGKKKQKSSAWEIDGDIENEDQPESSTHSADNERAKLVIDSRPGDASPVMRTTDKEDLGSLAGAEQEVLNDISISRSLHDISPASLEPSLMDDPVSSRQGQYSSSDVPLASANDDVATKEQNENTPRVEGAIEQALLEPSERSLGNDEVEPGQPQRPHLGRKKSKGKGKKGRRDSWAEGDKEEPNHQEVPLDYLSPPSVEDSSLEPAATGKKGKKEKKKLKQRQSLWTDDVPYEDNNTAATVSAAPEHVPLPSAVEEQQARDLVLHSDKRLGDVEAGLVEPDKYIPKADLQPGYIREEDAASLGGERSLDQTTVGNAVLQSDEETSPATERASKVARPGLQVTTEANLATSWQETLPDNHGDRSLHDASDGPEVVEPTDINLFEGEDYSTDSELVSRDRSLHDQASSVQRVPPNFSSFPAAIDISDEDESRVKVAQESEAAKASVLYARTIENGSDQEAVLPNSRRSGDLEPSVDGERPHQQASARHLDTVAEARHVEEPALEQELSSDLVKTLPELRDSRRSIEDVIVRDESQVPQPEDEAAETGGSFWLSWLPGGKKKGKKEKPSGVPFSVLPQTSHVPTVEKQDVDESNSSSTHVPAVDSAGTETVLDALLTQDQEERHTDPLQHPDLPTELEAMTQQDNAVGSAPKIDVDASGSALGTLLAQDQEEPDADSLAQHDTLALHSDKQSAAVYDDAGAVAGMVHAHVRSSANDGPGLPQQDHGMNSPKQGSSESKSRPVYTPDVTDTGIDAATGESRAAAPEIEPDHEWLATLPKKGKKGKKGNKSGALTPLELPEAQVNILDAAKAPRITQGEGLHRVPVSNVEASDSFTTNPVAVEETTADDVWAEEVSKKKGKKGKKSKKATTAPDFGDEETTLAHTAVKDLASRPDYSRSVVAANGPDYRPDEVGNQPAEPAFEEALPIEDKVDEDFALNSGFTPGDAWSGFGMSAKERKKAKKANKLAKEDHLLEEPATAVPGVLLSAEDPDNNADVQQQEREHPTEDTWTGSGMSVKDKKKAKKSKAFEVARLPSSVDVQPETLNKEITDDSSGTSTDVAPVATEIVRQSDSIVQKGDDWAPSKRIKKEKRKAKQSQPDEVELGSGQTDAITQSVDDRNPGTPQPNDVPADDLQAEAATMPEGPRGLREADPMIVNTFDDAPASTKKSKKDKKKAKKASFLLEDEPSAAPLPSNVGDRVGDATETAAPYPSAGGETYSASIPYVEYATVANDKPSAHEDPVVEDGIHTPEAVSQSKGPSIAQDVPLQATDDMRGLGEPIKTSEKGKWSAQKSQHAHVESADEIVRSLGDEADSPGDGSMVLHTAHTLTGQDHAMASVTPFGVQNLLVDNSHPRHLDIIPDFQENPPADPETQEYTLEGGRVSSSELSQVAKDDNSNVSESHDDLKAIDLVQTERDDDGTVLLPTETLREAAEQISEDFHGLKSTELNKAVSSHMDVLPPEHIAASDGVSAFKHPPSTTLLEVLSDSQRDVEAPKHDIDFAATLAAGLAHSGFNPNLVVDDPVFHRRASPPGVLAEADPEEVFVTTSKKGRKSRQSKTDGVSTPAVQDVQSDSTRHNHTTEEPMVSAIHDTNSADFSATLEAGLRDSGFDTDLLNKSSGRVEVSQTDEPEEFSFAQSKRKKGKKSKKNGQWESALKPDESRLTENVPFSQSEEPVAVDEISFEYSRKGKKGKKGRRNAGDALEEGIGSGSLPREVEDPNMLGEGHEGAVRTGLYSGRAEADRDTDAELSMPDPVSEHTSFVPPSTEQNMRSSKFVGEDGGNGSADRTSPHDTRKFPEVKSALNGTQQLTMELHEERLRTGGMDQAREQPELVEHVDDQSRMPVDTYGKGRVDTVKTATQTVDDEARLQHSTCHSNQTREDHSEYHEANVDNEIMSEKTANVLPERDVRDGAKLQDGFAPEPLSDDPWPPNTKKHKKGKRAKKPRTEEDSTKALAPTTESSTDITTSKTDTERVLSTSAREEKLEVNPQSLPGKVASLFPDLQRVKRRARSTDATELEPPDRNSFGQEAKPGPFHTLEGSRVFNANVANATVEGNSRSEDMMNELEGPEKQLDSVFQPTTTYTDKGQRQQPAAPKEVAQSDAGGAGMAASAVGRGTAMSSESYSTASNTEDGPRSEADRREDRQAPASLPLGQEPTWSFDDVRDSGIESLESPVAQEGASGEQSTRDSGYHDGPATPTLQQDLAERNATILPSPLHHELFRPSSGNLRSRRSTELVTTPMEMVSEQEWNLPVSKQRSMQPSPEYHANGIDGDENTLDGPPAVRISQLPKSGQPPPTQNQAVYHSSGAQNDGAFKPTSQSTEPSFPPDSATHGSLSRRDIASPPRSSIASPKGALHTIREFSLEASPSAKKDRTLSGVDVPEKGGNIPRQSGTTLQSFRERMRSPPYQSGVLSPSKTRHALDETLATPLSTDGLISQLSWPPVNEGQGAVGIDWSYNRDPAKPAAETLRSPSVQSHRSNSNAQVRITPEHVRSFSVSSNRTATPPLRRIDRSVSGDLRAAHKRGEAHQQGNGANTSLTKADIEPRPATPDASSRARGEELGTAQAAEMASVGIFEGWGDVRGISTSPTRPPSMQKRRSMHILDLESRLDQLVTENRELQNAKAKAEQSDKRGVDGHALQKAVETRDLNIREMNAEIHQIRAMLEPLQQEIARLTEVNGGLTEANKNLIADTNGRYATLQEEHAYAHQQWQHSSRELETLREQHTRLNVGMEEIVQQEIANALEEKNTEIRHLRAELDIATEQIRILHQQILANKTADFLTSRDEDYFDSMCQRLCQHVQQWVMRFSKFSDARACRLSSEITDDKIEARLDNAILDGSDVDMLLADRVRRRDVFMSVVMTMIWEYVFTRYLFGMDREQRQKLKALEKTLADVGPARAVAQWRATTLTLLSRRPAFASQRALDTDAVAHEIFSTLSILLPPPSQVSDQILTSLKNVLRLAVDLSIEMRTQNSEYIMLPPLQPEYDTNGDLVSKIHFNASLMNERSGEYSSNEELEQNRAVVKIVLFPLVVKKGDDMGEGNEEVVVCPAQVLVQGPSRGKKVVRVMSGAMEIDDPRQSRQSLVSASVMELGSNVI